MTTPDRRDLSLFQVEALLKSTAKQAQDKSRSVSSWLCLADTVLLLTAVDHDAEQIYLTNVGRMFDIQYRQGAVWLSPVGDDFVPCGWFTVSMLRKEVAEYNVTAPI